MSAEKRPASDDPGSSQLVKRQNVGSSTARSGGYGESSALIQAVCIRQYQQYQP